MALRLPGLHNHLYIRRLTITVGPASAAPPGKDSAAGQGQRARSRFCAGWRFAYPAYNPKSPLDQGPLKLPVLAASKSLRRSRQAGAARMDAG
ncbi:hypothetical protein LNP25_29550 [Klebsiella variicola subsp. variicola]|nr:hypothetical protein [Klebsiella variicola subsp. variicola]